MSIGIGIGIGVDVVLVPRFKYQFTKVPALRDRLFTPAGRALNLRSLAARFAAKEAGAKALGAPAGMDWQRCGIQVDAVGASHVVASGTVAEIADAQGVKKWHLSLSHDCDVATLMFVTEG